MLLFDVALACYVQYLGHANKGAINYRLVFSFASPCYAKMHTSERTPNKSHSHDNRINAEIITTLLICCRCPYEYTANQHISASLCCDSIHFSLFTNLHFSFVTFLSSFAPLIQTDTHTYKEIEQEACYRIVFLFRSLSGQHHYFRCNFHQYINLMCNRYSDLKWDKTAFQIV